MEIENKSRKNKYPCVAQYQLDYKLIEKKLQGCFNFTQQREGYIDEAQRFGKESSPYVTKKYDAVDPKQKYPRMHKPSPEKKTEKQSLSPASYQPMDSFKGSQLPKPKFYISKHSFKGFIHKEVSLKKHVPGSGAYDHEKGKNVITKGLAKGWK